MEKINKTKYTITVVIQKKTGQFGNAFLVRNEIKKNILSSETHNERLCKLRIKTKFDHISTVSVLVATEEKTDEENVSFMKSYE